MRRCCNGVQPSSLCLGDVTDALRVACERIVGWVSDYRVYLGALERAIRGPLWDPSWDPLPGAPRGPPGARARARARARGPGAPRPAPPARGPRAPPARPGKSGHFWPILGAIYILLYSRRGVFRGSPRTPRNPPPGGAPRGGQKSAHFFGYLITLPVGTVWALFSRPDFGGWFWGIPVVTLG